MALREDDALFALPLGGGTPRLASAVVDFLLACRPEWHRDAACTEHPELSWFEPDQADVAGAVCRRCPVAGECGAYAVENGVTAGMWAGVVRDPRRPSAWGTSHAWEDPEPSHAWEGGEPSQACEGSVASRLTADERPPAPAPCEWCPMPAKRGHELCRGCERKMVERYAV